MFRTIEDFGKFWESESSNTRKMLEALDEESLTRKVCDEHRDIARMAWHIVCTIPEMSSYLELKIEGPDPKSPVPGTLQEIKGSYSLAADSLLKQVVENWSDDDLLKEDDLYAKYGLGAKHSWL